MNLEKIVNDIKSIENFSLLLKHFNKLNDKQALMICNIILQHSDIINVSDIGFDKYERLIKLSIESNNDLIIAYGLVNSELDDSTYEKYLETNNNSSDNIILNAVYIKSLKLKMVE
jgi:hypothetical protein